MNLNFIFNILVKCLPLCRTFIFIVVAFYVLIAAFRFMRSLI